MGGKILVVYAPHTEIYFTSMVRNSNYHNYVLVYIIIFDHFLNTKRTFRDSGSSWGRDCRKQLFYMCFIWEERMDLKGGSRANTKQLFRIKNIMGFCTRIYSCTN